MLAQPAGIIARQHNVTWKSKSSQLGFQNRWVTLNNFGQDTIYTWQKQNLSKWSPFRLWPGRAGIPTPAGRWAPSSGRGWTAWRRRGACCCARSTSCAWTPGGGSRWWSRPEIRSAECLKEYHANWEANLNTAACSPPSRIHLEWKSFPDYVSAVKIKVFQRGRVPV